MPLVLGSVAGYGSEPPPVSEEEGKPLTVGEESFSISEQLLYRNSETDSYLRLIDFYTTQL